jgi:hypothetical protein
MDKSQMTKRIKEAELSVSALPLIDAHPRHSETRKLS